MGDIYVEGGGLWMGTGSFTVANLDFSRAQKVSFLGPSAVLGAGMGRRVDVKGKMRFIDQHGATYLALDPDGSLQARKLSLQHGFTANASWLRSNVSVVLVRLPLVPVGQRPCVCTGGNRRGQTRPNIGMGCKL